MYFCVSRCWHPTAFAFGFESTLSEGTLRPSSRTGSYSSQVDWDLQSFQQDALALAQREAGTPDANDGVVER